MTDYRKMKNVFLIKRIRKTSKNRFWLFIIMFFLLLSNYVTTFIGWLYNAFGANPFSMSTEILNSWSASWFIFIIFTAFMLYIIFGFIWALMNYFIPNTHSCFDALGEYEGEILNNLYALQRDFVESGIGGTFRFNVVSGINKVTDALKNKANREEENDAEDAPQVTALRAWRVYITSNYIFYNGIYRLKLERVENVVCIYKQRTINNSFLTRWASKKRDLIIGFVNSSEWNINFKRKRTEAEKVIAFLKKEMPWILTVEDDKKIKKHWEEDKDNLIYEVLERNERYLNGEPMVDVEETDEPAQ